MRKFLITVNGSSYEVLVEEIGGVAHVQPTLPVAAAPVAAAPVAVEAPAAPAAATPQAITANGAKIESPMPGTILSTLVQVGQNVKKGDVLVVLEAMKMENEIPSTVNGKVLQLAVSKGSTVNTGDVLVVIG